MGPDELFKKLVEHLTGEEDESTFVTAATLQAEDITRSKVFTADKAKINGELNVLAAKMQALMAKKSALHAEFWEHLYSTYTLPRDGRYDIKDGMIRKKPKEGGPGIDVIHLCGGGDCK